MSFSLIQYREIEGARGIAVLEGEERATRIPGVASVIELARIALAEGKGLAEKISELGDGGLVDFEAVELLLPVDLPDPAHVLLSGTGLTHLGSAESRDQMHRKAAADLDPTDAMKMFLMGIEGGKPVGGGFGVQPEWFYKGDGMSLVSPGAPIMSPWFALDGGEEAEIAGVYWIDDDGTPVRLGFALANEFSDHVTERGNYLWLAHSKLRQAALGPELFIGDLPQDVRGTSRVIRDGTVIWERPFLSGEANMSHSVANLENHHFKYELFRRPGRLHIHFLGAAALSFSEGLKTAAGDVFEIEAAPFILPVRNELRIGEEKRLLIKSV